MTKTAPKLTPGQRLQFKWQRFCSRPRPVVHLVALALVIVTLLTIVSVYLFTGSERRQYLLDLQLATDNQLDSFGFEIIVPPAHPDRAISQTDLDQLKVDIQQVLAEFDFAVDFGVLKTPWPFLDQFDDSQSGS